MKIWRPEDRLEWWMSFLASVFLIPLAIGFVGVALADAGFPYLILIALLSIPLAGSYLLLVTKLHIAIRIALAITFCCVLLYAFQPRSSCGDYDNDAKTAEISGDKASNQESCG